VAAKLGHKRIAVVALDYVAGQEQAEGFIKAFMESGGKSVERVFFPLGTIDVAPYVTKIQNKVQDFDAVIGILWGPSAPQWLKAWQEYGLKDKLPLLTLGETVNEIYLRQVGDAALGIVSWLPYSPVLETAENKRFVQAMNKKYKKEPVYNTHLGYIAAKAVGEALKTVNGNVEDQARFLDALRKVRFEAPGGTFRFDEKQNAVIPTYIRRVEKVGGKLQSSVIEQEGAGFDLSGRAPDALLHDLDEAIMALDFPRTTALARAYLQTGADRRAYQAAVALCACRFEDDPHNQKITISTFEEYGQNSTHLRDRLLLATARLLAGWLKMPGGRDCFARFEKDWIY